MNFEFNILENKLEFKKTMKGKLFIESEIEYTEIENEVAQKELEKRLKTMLKYDLGIDDNLKELLFVLLSSEKPFERMEAHDKIKKILFED